MAGGFLGKPYEPNGVVKNDIEFILNGAEARWLPQAVYCRSTAQRHSSRPSQGMVSAGVVWCHGCLNKASSSAVSYGACRTPHSDVQLRGRHSLGPVSWLRNDDNGRDSLGTQQHRNRSRSVLLQIRRRPGTERDAESTQNTHGHFAPTGVLMLDVEALMQDAIRHFWQTRQSQSDRQGATTGVRDAGNRTAVTGGKHADGFVNLVRRVVIDAGVKDAHIRSTKKTGRTLSGYFRPAKRVGFGCSE